MNHVTYKRTSNLCIIVAAASVILFDKFPELHRLAGGLLIASGVVAAAVHFYVQWRPVQTAEEPRPADAESGSLVVSIENTREPVRVAETLVRNTGEAVELWHKAPFKTGGWFLIDYLSRPSIDAATVAQVCQKLAATEMDFEVKLTGDGSLTIRPIRRKEVFETIALEDRFTKGELETSGLIQ